MDNKQKYIEFCKNEKAMPIFSKPFWLDAVCGEDGWDVILVEKGGEIFASMPYVKPMVRHLLTYSTMPKLTQKLGPYIKYPNGQKYEAKLAYEKKIVKEIIELLPQVDYFSQNFNLTVTNWLPWYWAKFSQTTRYSYRLPYTVNFNDIVKNFSRNNRQLFNKKEHNINIVHNLTTEEFYNTCKKTFDRQNLLIPYSLDLVKRIFKTCSENNAGLAFFAIDENGDIHSVSYEIWDDSTVYSLFGGSDTKLRSQGGKNYIMFNAIKFAMDNGKDFDFEGSMIESIENFYRQFGAIQTPYFQITKLSRKAKILYGLKNLANDIIKG